MNIRTVPRPSPIPVFLARKLGITNLYLCWTSATNAVFDLLESRSVLERPNMENMFTQHSRPNRTHAHTAMLPIQAHCRPFLLKRFGLVRMRASIDCLVSVKSSPRNCKPISRTAECGSLITSGMSALTISFSPILQHRSHFHPVPRAEHPDHFASNTFLGTPRGIFQTFSISHASGIDRACCAALLHRNLRRLVLCLWSVDLGVRSARIPGYARRMVV
jgi:hypothetical protein